MSKFYLIEMPDDWKGPGKYDCDFCYIVNECYPYKCPEDCPIGRAKKASKLPVVSHWANIMFGATEPCELYVVEEKK